MKKVYLFLILTVVVLFALATYAFWFLPYLNNQATNQPAVNNSQASASPTLGFVPVTVPPVPPFLKNVSVASDVKVDFHYDGDFIPPNTWFGDIDYYTPQGSTEKFVSLSKIKDRQDFAYGSDSSYEIFSSEESHSYQGTPLFVTNPNKKYSLSYLGFNISDQALISQMHVDLGIDYLADRIAVGPESSSFSIASLFGIETAQACGPGVYLRKVGTSNLVFAGALNGIAWYVLEKPIALYNLDLDYCDNPPGQRPSYCHDWADDPADCWKWCGPYNTSINDLSKGNLRMHVFYKPNDNQGLLKIQMANMIVADPSGNYYQATMGQGFDHYYRAYLH